MIATKHLTPAWVYDRELTTFKTYSTLVCLNAAKLALCLLPLQQMAKSFRLGTLKPNSQTQSWFLLSLGCATL